jgi:hypothetical protein
MARSSSRSTSIQVSFHPKAVRRRNRTDLYDAPEWLVGKKGTGSPLNLHRMLAPDLTRDLRFISPDSEKGLQFKKNTSDLDEQTLRGVRYSVTNFRAHYDLARHFQLVLIGLGVIFLVVGGYHRIRAAQAGDRLDRTQEGWATMIGLAVGGGLSSREKFATPRVLGLVRIRV